MLNWRFIQCTHTYAHTIFHSLQCMPNQLPKSVIQLQAKIHYFNWSIKHDPLAKLNNLRETMLASIRGSISTKQKRQKIKQKRTEPQQKLSKFKPNYCDSCMCVCSFFWYFFFFLIFWYLSMAPWCAYTSYMVQCLNKATRASDWWSTWSMCVCMMQWIWLDYYLEINNYSARFFTIKEKIHRLILGCLAAAKCWQTYFEIKMYITLMYQIHFTEFIYWIKAMIGQLTTEWQNKFKNII